MRKINEIKADMRAATDMDEFEELSFEYLDAVPPDRLEEICQAEREGNCRYIDFFASDFGETVFLTREEAKAALRGSGTL